MNRYYTIKGGSYISAVIGISSYYVNDSEMGTVQERLRGVSNQDMSMCSTDYLNAIYKAKGIPIILSPIANHKYIKKVLDMCDGILFSGGSDLNPLYYGETPSESGTIVPQRDKFEMMLLKQAVKKDIPVLGICRGLQLINVFYNGSLHQDINLANPKQEKHDIINLPKWHKIHKVKIKKDSHLARAYQVSSINTNSLHHQSINELGDNLKITAQTADKTIEGIEVKDKSFTTAVQWHPEMMFSHFKIHLRLFEYFVDKSHEYKNQYMNKST